jgi:hypothetical protein
LPAGVITARPSHVRTGEIMKVAGLVLAAGGGTRFGRPKAVVEVGSRRLVDLAIESCLRAELSPVVVVLGAAWLTPMPPAGSVAGTTTDIWLVDNTEWAGDRARRRRPGRDSRRHSLRRRAAPEAHRCGSCRRRDGCRGDVQRAGPHPCRTGSRGLAGRGPNHCRGRRGQDVASGQPPRGHGRGVRRPRPMDRRRLARRPAALTCPAERDQPALARGSESARRG